MPRFNLPPCPTQLSEEHIAEYWRNGYLAFSDVLTPGEVEDACAALTELVQRLARDPKRTSHSSAWFTEGSHFWVQFERGYEPANAGEADVELKVRKLMSYHDQHPVFERLTHRHPRIKGILDGLLGPGSFLFQDVALIKPPFIGTEKPWHQDNAYFSVTPLDAVTGVWIALDDATVANGCMHVMPGKHREALKHHHDRDCEIMPDRLNGKAPMPVEIPSGGAMFFCGMLPHQTPPNSSHDRRRALQFHYRSADSQSVEKAEYDLIYAEPDGTPASCIAARD